MKSNTLSNFFSQLRLPNDARLHVDRAHSHSTVESDRFSVMCEFQSTFPSPTEEEDVRWHNGSSSSSEKMPKLPQRSYEIVISSEDEMYDNFVIKAASHDNAGNMLEFIGDQLNLFGFQADLVRKGRELARCILNHRVRVPFFYEKP